MVEILYLTSSTVSQPGEGSPGGFVGAVAFDSRSFFEGSIPEDILALRLPAVERSRWMFLYNFMDR